MMFATVLLGVIALLVICTMIVILVTASLNRDHMEDQLKHVNLYLKQMAINTAPVVGKTLPPKPSDNKRPREMLDKEPSEWIP